MICFNDMLESQSQYVVFILLGEQNFTIYLLS